MNVDARTSRRATGNAISRLSATEIAAAATEYRIVFSTCGPRSPWLQAALKFENVGGAGGASGLRMKCPCDSKEIITTYATGIANSSPIRIPVVIRQVRRGLRSWKPGLGGALRGWAGRVA